MDPAIEAHDELDLRHYIAVLWRRKLVVAIATIAIAAVSILLSVRQTPQYRATSEVLLRGTGAEQRLGASPFEPNDTGVETEMGVMRSDLVQGVVAEALGYSPAVSISRQISTDLVNISSTSTDPERAAETANVFAQTYVDWKLQTTVDELQRAQQTVQSEIDSLQEQLAAVRAPLDDLDLRILIATTPEEQEVLRSQRESLASDSEVQRTSLTNQISLYQQEMSQLQVSQRITRTGGAQVVSLADAPSSPFAPQPIRRGVLGILFGSMVGIGIAFLVEALDDRLRSKEDVQKACGWPTVGLVPVDDRPKSDLNVLVTLNRPSSVVAESYRALRTAVQFLCIDEPIRTIQVTSPKSGDGKTTTAANLAVTMAQAGNRVILLDADLRRPGVHDVFGLKNRTGFTSILLGTSTVGQAFFGVGVDGLIVIPAGPPPPNPSELLSLARTRDLFKRLRDECDILIVDTPPVLPVTDPLVVSGYADGVLVVTDAASARVREMRRTTELLRQVSANVLGVVLNRTSPEAAYKDSNNYGYGFGTGDAAESDETPATNP